MTNEVTEPKTAQQRFEEELYGRLRDDVAQLLPDDVLAEMAHRALEKMFFEPRRVRRNSSSYDTTMIDKPSWFEERVERLMRQRTREFADKYMRDNADKLAEMFEECLRSTMPMIIARAFFVPIDNRIGAADTNVMNAVSDYIEKRFGVDHIVGQL